MQQCFFFFFLLCVNKQRQISCSEIEINLNTIKIQKSLTIPNGVMRNRNSKDRQCRSRNKKVQTIIYKTQAHKLLQQGHVAYRQKSSLQKLFGRHHNLVDPYEIHVYISQMTMDFGALRRSFLSSVTAKTFTGFDCIYQQHGGCLIRRRNHLPFTPGFLVGPVLPIVLVFVVVLLCVFTF